MDMDGKNHQISNEALTSAVAYQGRAVQDLLRGPLEVCNIGDADTPFECRRLQHACEQP